MNALNGIDGLNGLGELSPGLCKCIQDKSQQIKGIYQRTGRPEGMNGLGSTDVAVAKKESKNKGKGKTMSFEEVFSLYNQGITEDEVKAWVWYKRSMGVPMTGWQKFFLAGEKGIKEKLVVTTRPTVVKDNHFRDIKNMPEGTVLGKFVKKHRYDESTEYYIYKDDHSLHYVEASNCRIKEQGSTASPGELKKLVDAGALFYLDGELLPYPVYAYGNMYERELQLGKDRDSIQAAYGNEVFEAHEKVIRDNKPEMLTVTSPDPVMRPIITAISDVAQDVDIFGVTYVREDYMDLEKADQFKKVNGETRRKSSTEKISIKFNGEKKFTLQEVFCAWLFTLNTDTDFRKSAAIDIVDYYVLNKSLRDDKMSKEEKSELRANARIEGEEMFSRFLHEVLTFEDQQKLDYTWNKLYNGWPDIKYMKIPIAFECSARFKTGILMLSDAQRQGVAFMEAVGSGINAFDVGVGKTMTSIANLATNMYNGKCKRPLVVVPKPTYEKWIAEIVGIEKKKGNGKEFIPGVLSYTNVKVNSWFNLGTQVVKNINLNKAVPENSITIVTYEGLKKIGFGRNISAEFIDELINILGQSNEKTARDKELDYQSLREMIGVGMKNTIADIDTLGFDYIVIDEAHRCKNVFSMVKKDENNNKRYNMSGSTSETGQKVFFLTNYLQRKFGRNVMLLTATPFTNSPLEIYSMLSHVAYESFQRNNLRNLDTFMDLFVLPTMEWTANYKEEIVEKEVIKKFNNRILLSRLIYNHIHFKTGEEAGVKRPCKINLPLLYGKSRQDKSPVNKQVLTYLNMTPRQRENQNGIVASLKAATQGKLDNALMFRALNASLNNALSPFLFRDTPEDYLDFVEESPKIKYVCDCIRSVKEYHEKNKEPISGQVIYMNRAKQFFPYIKEYLEKEIGYKKGLLFDKVKVDEVEILTSEATESKKENVKEAFLEGVVKVIIGTATIREGIDLQKNGSAIYNCYPEWNPTDIRQLEGRIWRQGNKFGYVRIVMPLVQDSMDVFVFQKLEEKTSRINDIWFRGNRGNVLDLESLDPQEIKLALITDVNRIVKMFFDQELEELAREVKRAKNAINQISDIKWQVESYTSYRDQAIEQIKSNYNLFKGDDYFKKGIAEKKFTKEQINKANDLLKALADMVEKQNPDDREILSVFRKWSGFGKYEPYWLGYYKERVSILRKTERNILKPKGYDLTSNFEEVEKKLEQDYVAIFKKGLDFLTPDNLEKIKEKTTDETILNTPFDQIMERAGEGSEKWKSLKADIESKKSALNVTGKTPSERAKEFAQLNYLLSFLMKDIDPGQCSIPSPKMGRTKKAIPVETKKIGEDLLIAEAEAEAILILLELDI